VNIASLYIFETIVKTKRILYWWWDHIYRNTVLVVGSYLKEYCIGGGIVFKGILWDYQHVRGI